MKEIERIERAKRQADKTRHEKSYEAGWIDAFVAMAGILAVVLWVSRYL
jgi:hypothetical protein